tara:strand:+ start:239 stop:505 length:267 start_codon:yes stop_codon:yes gene_type:complete
MTTRIETQGSKGQGYRNLKKEMNASTKDELIMNLLEKYRKLQAITSTCAYCSDNIIITKDIRASWDKIAKIKDVCNENNHNNTPEEYK